MMTDKFLQQNWLCLVENLTSSVNHHILDQMFSKLKLSKDEYDSIYECGKTDCDKARKLLQLVSSRGEPALKVFKETLQDYNPELYERLQQTEEDGYSSSSVTLEKAVFSSDHDSDDSVSSGIGCASPTSSDTPSNEEEDVDRSAEPVRMTVSEMNEMMEDLEKKGKESRLQSHMKKAKKSFSKLAQLADLCVKQEEGELGFGILHLNRKGAKEMLQRSYNDGTLKEKVQEPLANLAKGKHNFLNLEADVDLHWRGEQGESRQKEDAKGYDGTINVTAKALKLADDYVLEEGSEGAFECLCDYLVKNPDELGPIIEYLNSINIQVCDITRGCIERKFRCAQESAVHLQEEEETVQSLKANFQVADTAVTCDSEKEITSMEIVMDKVHEEDASNKSPEKPADIIAPLNVTENSISITWADATGAKDYSISITPADGDNPTKRVNDAAPLEYSFPSKFPKMQMSFDTSGSKVKFRGLSGEIKLPKTWTGMGDGDEYREVDLHPTTDEYKKVHQQFMQSVATASGCYHAVSTARVLKIQRIQNATLWKQYMVKKKKMELDNARSTQPVERILYHGVPVGPIPSINRHGFNRSYSGRNVGSRFGNGVYFAATASISGSNQYARPDPNGQRYMYMARVLTGDMCQGQSSIIVPPAKDTAKPHITYDSVCDNPANPQIIVIFYDTQAYPEYLITFTK